MATITSCLQCYTLYLLVNSLQTPYLFIENVLFRTMIQSKVSLLLIQAPVLPFFLYSCVCVPLSIFSMFFLFLFSLLSAAQCDVQCEPYLRFNAVTTSTAMATLYVFIIWCSQISKHFIRTDAWEEEKNIKKIFLKLVSWNEWNLYTHFLFHFLSTNHLPAHIHFHLPCG